VTEDGLGAPDPVWMVVDVAVGQPQKLARLGKVVVEELGEKVDLKVGINLSYKIIFGDLTVVTVRT